MGLCPAEKESLMKFAKWIVVAGIAAAMPIASADQGTGQKSLLNKAETKFVTETMMDLMVATRLSNQVVLTSTSPKLQFIAKNNVAIYTEMMFDLKGFAIKNKVDLPTSLDAKHTAIWNRISPLRGVRQTQVYLHFTAQLEMHLALDYKHHSSHSKNASFRAFSNQQLVILVRKR